MLEPASLFSLISFPLFLRVFRFGSDQRKWISRISTAIRRRGEKAAARANANSSADGRGSPSMESHASTDSEVVPLPSGPASTSLSVASSSQASRHPVMFWKKRRQSGTSKDCETNCWWFAVCYFAFKKNAVGQKSSFFNGRRQVRDFNVNSAVSLRIAMVPFSHRRQLDYVFTADPKRSRPSTRKTTTSPLIMQIAHLRRLTFFSRLVLYT